MSHERRSKRGGRAGVNLGRLVVPGRPQVPPPQLRAAGQRLKAILAAPDPVARVRAMAVQDLFLLVKNVGLPDAVELLELADPEQVQRMLDLDVWTRDRLDTRRYAEWLEVMLEAYAERFDTLLDDLDLEPLLVFLKRHAAFYLNTEDMPEPLKEHLAQVEAEETPDGMFLLELPSNDPHEDLIRLFVDRLYRADLKRAQTLLLGLIGELPSQLEETAYRLRTGRLEELGFLEYDEALALYRPLPASQPVPRRSRVDAAPTPVQLAPTRYLHRDRNAFLAEALQVFSRRYPHDDLSFDLIALSNRVMVAERLNPGEPQEQVRAIQIVLDLVGLGLALLSRGSVDAAVEALHEVHLSWLFRLAHTRTLELRRRARRIERSLRADFRRLPGPHADSPYLEVLEGLKGLRPQYYLGLEPDAPSSTYVTFHDPAQIERVAQELDILRAVQRFVFSHLAIDPPAGDTLARSLARYHRRLTPGGVLLTAAARRMLGDPMAPRPLEPGEFQTWLSRAFEGPVKPGALRPLADGFAGELISAARAFDAEHGEGGVEKRDPGPVTRFVMRLLDETREAYGALDPSQPVDPRLVGGPVYLTEQD